MVSKFLLLKYYHILFRAGADLGGGGGGAGGRKFFLLRDSTPCRPKGSPLWYYYEIHFWPTDPKIFLRAPLAQIYTNFEGERAPKTRRKFFKNCPKTVFLNCFSKFCLRRRKFDQNIVFLMLEESSESQFGRPKKKVVKIFEIFLKIRPLEKILDPPLVQSKKIF